MRERREDLQVQLVTRDHQLSLIRAREDSSSAHDVLR
jgi:hypothetical protein